jgi:transposase
MVFVSYAPATKAAFVRLSLQGQSRIAICNLLGYSVSRQSLDQWKALYYETRAVVRDPETYAAQGRPSMLSVEDSEFMVELFQSQPGLFLSEIQEKLYDNQGSLLSLQAIHNNLVTKLAITLKKADTVNI